MLLEKIEASARAVEVYTAESTRTTEEINERVTAIEARIAEIEEREKRSRKANEDWGAAVMALKRKIDSTAGIQGIDGKNF